MDDYSDSRKWTEVRLWNDQVYLSEYTEYSPQDILGICEALVEKAERLGLKNCHIKFESIPVCVTAVGYRPLNREEKSSIREDKNQ